MATATLKMFLVFGDPKRLRTVELSNWTGKAVAGPRSEFDRILEREESQNSGVYFLTGTDPDNDKSVIYVGEAESIKDRVKAHLSKDYWNQIAFFISKDENLTKAHVRYIEGRLIEEAKVVGRSVVMNGQGSGSKLPESDREEMEVFLEKVLQILPVLGIESFVKTGGSESPGQRHELLTCAIKDAVATGYLTPNGMLVKAGSQAVLEERASAKKWPTVLAHRNKLIEEGGLIHQEGRWVFVKDTEFSSPSAAAAVIHGGSANGLVAWKDAHGRTLKDVESE
ncbi:GIY-YIG nuclease family protein [Gilvimarinus xylanilyticus]|uniref:GIY-YIG nuclease family protein n=1 Tax=Gilvimarinus xylanilyticus TaxID=2944139 RepID=A0A9X2KT13_9GAMM|nr:GIY-YIG nuclease family protein [Gilvimarinus xylanilyticus]